MPKTKAPIWEDYFVAADRALFRETRQRIGRALAGVSRDLYHEVMTQVDVMAREGAAAVADALTTK